MNTSLTEEEWSLTSRERCLLSLLLGEKLKAKDMDLLMSGADIDRENQNWLLMLSRVGYMQGWDLFPKEIIPRLKGIHRYAQVHNTMRIPWLMDKIRTLRHANIPVMLIKGLALRFYYSVGMPRVMGDYDIAVPEECFEKAMSLLQGLNYNASTNKYSYHGHIVENNWKLEIHRWIFKHNGERNTDIWERALYFNLYGQDVCVPCPEDMFIHQLDNRSRDMFSAIYDDRRINWLYDCRCILETFDNVLDMISISQRAKEFDVLYNTRRMMLLFADTFPDIISVKDVEKAIPATHDYEKWFRNYQYFRTLSVRIKTEHQDTLTPYYILKRVLLKYRLYKQSRKTLHFAYPGPNFRQFLLKDLGAENLAGLIRKYRTKFSIK